MKSPGVKSNIDKDFAVLILGYNRPDFLKKRLTELSKQNFENLYLSIDGGKASRTQEMYQLKKFAIKKFNHLNVFALNHYSKNLGVDLHTFIKVSEVLKKHKYIVVIEDDVKISENFILNILNGLRILENRKVLGLVSSWSPLSCKTLQNKWRISTYSFTWGWACSRETWDKFEFDMYGNDIFTSFTDSKIWDRFSSHQRVQWGSKFKNVRKHIPVPWDVQFFCYAIKNNLTLLCPLFAFSENEGFNDKRSVHNKVERPFIFSKFKSNQTQIDKFSKLGYVLCNLLDKYYMNDFKSIQKIKGFLKF